MANARDVARYLIRLAALGEEPDYLTHLRLQKLLYYTEGWSLALRGKSLFPERIEAWSHGPVVKDVYPVFASYGGKPIPPDEVADPEGLDEDDCELVGAVWESYKGYTALGLREKTHKEKPWVEARGNLDPAARCENEITRDALQSYFGSLVQS